MNAAERTKKQIATFTTLWCAACNRAILEGDAYTLVPVGPGLDPTQRERARRGDKYEPVRAPVHWACATGEEQ